MLELAKPVQPDRIDFSKIHVSVAMPNLIEVQKRSYERFLQMNVIAAEREDDGLQAVFKSIFPISDFRDTCSLEFVEYAIGNWECKCGNLKGIDKLRTECDSCKRKVYVQNPKSASVSCPDCGHVSKHAIPCCDHCGDPVQLNLRYNVEECQERGMTYTVPLKVTIRLVVWNKDPETGTKSIHDIKEQEVYFGEIPLLTESGTFIVNGTQRVIVSQLHRSPGVFFQASDRRTVFMAKLIPYRGSWVEFEYDAKNLLYVRIDRKRRFLGTVFLRALGLKTNEEILAKFHQIEQVKVDGKKLLWKFSSGIMGRKVKGEVKHPKTGEVLSKGRAIRKAAYRAMKEAGVEQVPMDVSELAEGAFTATDLVDLETGEVILEANEAFTPAVLEDALTRGIVEFRLFFPEQDPCGSVISETLRKDTIRTSDEALVEIYRKLRPGDPPTVESSRSLFEGMFFDGRRYDFSRVGRLKFNNKLGTNAPLDERVLSPEDFFRVSAYLLGLRKGYGELDDIDHLGNRRVRSVGELLENQFRIGLVRMERAIKEKMSVYQEMTTAMPHDLINAKPVMAAIQEFFGSSQLSQFMDQTNPLSEVTHKRRLSALGPGGLSRERAGFEVRDVHPTHYGRICPIETPEGPNIGLISSLSCYARINEFGFIESPYRKVENGRVVDYVRVLNPGGSKLSSGDVITAKESVALSASLASNKADPITFEPHIFYLSAWEEDNYFVAQANAQLDKDSRFVNKMVQTRAAGDFVLTPREKVQYIDVSPKQLVSVAASLIPFLENDDANRALMGSNMQRQAVPLLRAEAPYVGTGMESITARDSGAVVLCRRDGIIDTVDSSRIIVRVGGDENDDDFGADIYQLT
ncbi:MAG: DNA-directed RNA polymerase subunit beta, partial [Acidobacteria bacterium]